MVRRDYHPWGEELDDHAFLQAVIMAAAFAEAAAVPEHDPRRGRFNFMRAFAGQINDEDPGDDEDPDHLAEEKDPDDPHNDDDGWVWHVVGSGLPLEPARLPEVLRACPRPPRDLAAMWQKHAPDGVSFTLVGGLAHAQAVAWIAALADLGPGHTVHCEAPLADAAASWGVPTRVAVFGRDEAAARWRGALAELARDLPDRVIDVTDQRGERDLEILAAPLRASLAAVLTDGRGPRARLVCVVGGVDVPPTVAGSMLAVLRDEFSALGVVLTSVEPSEARAWLTTQLDDGWWIDAVWSHARERDRPLPFIAVDPSLHRARSPWDLMHAAAARAALRLDREGLDRMAARLTDRHSRAWLRSVIAVNRPNSAMGGPSDEGPHERLIGLQTALGGLGRPLTPPIHDGWRPPEARHARAEVSRASGDGWRPVDRLVAGASHRVDVWIGGAGGTPADEEFPWPDEPDADGSVALTIVLCPIAPREPVVPQSAAVRLPARGDSERATFFLRPATTTFAVRVVVLHRQRVLQTLLLTQTADEPLRWSVELRVHDGLGPELGEREPFDAAIVVNPSTALAIGADGAGLALLPAGSDAAVRAIQEILAGDEIRGEDRRPGDRISADALHRLALHGHALWDAVVNRPGMREHLAHARRIQIVEAREGAYLPVELFYARPAPERPKLCASADAPLRAGMCNDPACAAEPTRYVCPHAFWGLSRVLERMPHPGRPLVGGADLALVPAPEEGRDTLAPFERAVYAASAVVQPPEERRIKKALRRLVRGPLRKVRGWRGVAGAVRREQPSLLALIVHTTDDGTDDGSADVLLQLELADQRLAAANLTAAYIHNGEAARPLVLLVGCDTRAPLAGYRGFAGRFLRHGAAIVVCTIAAISPEDAADFLEQFAGALRDAAGREANAFGELMLATRQRLFAVRWPMALGVVSCGDALWYIDR